MAGIHRALIAGTGSIGRRHVATLRTLRPDLRFALLRADARRDAYSRELDAEVFSTLETALAWGPDLAVIATPTDLHAALIGPLVDAGVATFIEKPVVITAEDADDLSRRDPAALPPTQVGCVLRFLEVFGTLRTWLDEGRLGRLARARIECGQYLPDWRPGTDYRLSYSATSERGGGVIFDLVHELDLAVGLLGAERLEHVMAAKRSALELACEDVALLHLTSADGLPISVGLDYVSRTPVRNVEIVGEDASARLDFIGRRLTLTGPHGVVETMDAGFDIEAAYTTQFAELIGAIEQGTGTRLPLHEGLKATRLAIAAHQSLSHRMRAAA